MSDFIAWGHDSGTHEIPSARRGLPFAEQPTAEIDWPWGTPSLPTVHLTPRARLRRSRNRFLASSFVADLRRGWSRSMAIIGLFTAVCLFFAAIRGVWVVALMAGLAR